MHRKSTFSGNLVSTWFGLNSLKSDQAAADQVNRTLNTGYDRSTLNHWRNGTRAIPAPVQRLMRLEVLCQLGHAELAPLMEPPERVAKASERKSTKKPP